jgi:hypothetical protein
VPLLVLADPRQPFRRDGTVGRSLVTVGDDDVRDLAPLFHQLRDGATGAELGIVRVRGHDHDPLGRSRHEPTPVGAAATISLA